ncbi:MAG: class I fructose-bisphosphate aldolase [Patescibacteria group bacterium]
MPAQQLQETVKAMMATGKGLLAADESSKSVPKRLDPIKVESNPENRRRFRSLYLEAPGAEQYMSGVILVDETIRQSGADGKLFPQSLAARGIVPGIKVDAGTSTITSFPNEELTEGLDGLAARLKEYADLGARFAKWRAVIRIGDGLPSEAMLDANALQLAIYAARCQSAGIVPMVEPEVLLHGKHTIEKAEEVTTNVLKTVIAMLKVYKVDLTGVIMKTSMIVPGDESGAVMDPNLIAEATSRVLRATIPENMGGVVFLSGGQTGDQATLNLNAIKKLGPYPWLVTFCYARALQYPALDVWAGKDENLPQAREAFLARLKACSAASTGNLG